MSITRSTLKCECEEPLPIEPICLPHKIDIIINSITERKIAAREGHTCSVDGCINLARAGKGGTCVRHSGRRVCKFKGCTKLRQDANFCKAHNGKHKNSRCKAPGCEKFNQRGGFCFKHGGGYRCTYNNCSRSAHSSKIRICNKHLKTVKTINLI